VRRLPVIVPITLTAIFFLQFVAFDAGPMTFLILLNVPFAFVGGILALPPAGLNLSVREDDRGVRIPAIPSQKPDGYFVEPNACPMASSIGGFISFFGPKYAGFGPES
jgi:hypothetical protein